MSVIRRIRVGLGISLVAVFAGIIGCASPGDSGPNGDGVSLGEARSPMLFQHPMFHGVYVDYCLHFSRDCGQPAADKFCQMKGYQTAVDFAVALGLVHTVILGDPGSECNHPGCGGFEFIDCL